MIGSDKEYAYRNRTNFKLKVESSGEVKFGFFKEKSHEFLSITRCEISNEKVNSVIKDISQVNLGERKYPSRVECELQEVEGGVLCGLSFHPKASKKEKEEVYKLLKGHPLILSVNDKSQITGEYHLFDNEPLNYYTRSAQFQQVNIGANRKLRKLISENAIELGIKKVVDLYCGGGNLSIHLAKQGMEVHGVEINEQSIKSAKYTLEKNNIQAHYEAGKMESFLSSDELKNADLVITDPPRRGMSESIDKLIKLDPKYIFYVSCDPNTLARDLAIFSEKKYKLKKLYGFDFFPQTYHVESFVILEKGSD